MSVKHPRFKKHPSLRTSIDKFSKLQELKGLKEGEDPEDGEAKEEGVTFNIWQTAPIIERPLPDMKLVALCTKASISHSVVTQTPVCHHCSLPSACCSSYTFMGKGRKHWPPDCTRTRYL